MGFSWTPITQFVTEVAAAHINQVKTNVDTVYTDLELSIYNWQYLPVSADDEIQHEDFKELRDAIDYADDQNYCRSHDATYNAGDDAVAQSTVYTGENTGYDSGYKAGVDSTYRATVYSSQNSGYDSGYKSYVDNDHKSGVDNDANTGVDTADKETVHASVQTNYCSNNKAAIYNGDKVTVNSSYNVGV